MLDFLNTVTILDVAEKTTGRTGGPRKQRNPEGLAIRVFRDGSVFPSTELIEKFNLEYTDKGAEKGTMGFDVIDTDLYPSFSIPAGNRILIISAVSKTLPKVDLFGSTTYDEAGKPKTSVLDQGSKTFGSDDLIPAIEEIYNVIFAKPAKDDQPAVEGVEFVDMVFFANPATGLPWAGKPVTYIPKSVSRGKDKGSVTTQRREAPEFYAFLPAVMVAEPAEVKEASEDESVGIATTELVEDDVPMVESLSPFAPVTL